jgi:small subunit ribosomal protein S13
VEESKSMSTEFKHIVRLMNKDLDGTKNVSYALLKIKGVGIQLANAIIAKANVPPEKRLGFLSDSEIKSLEEIMLNIGKYDFPTWFFNYRKNGEAGENRHLITSDLDLKVKTDINALKAMRCWRGYRHAFGLKVRGQRTKTTGRAGKAMGVKKKTLARRQ